MSNKKIHLVCNAHLDPVWLWQRQEGMAEAISTFRIAADFCEQNADFIFCHNESLLYEWVEKIEPKLFARIKQLVAAGRWHIMGGWFLQPDCNMCSGESIIRQYLAGKKYFMEKFGVYPETAINFDPFGHSKGIVQILMKAGFKNYLFGRPLKSELPLPGETFIWHGYANSRIVASRLFDNYLSLRGEALDKLKKFIKESPDKTGLLPWGIGNHGGGPSKIDLAELDDFRKNSELEIIHSTPDNYFREVDNNSLPVFADDINPVFIGCYTSQIKIKQRHRKLENSLKLQEIISTYAFHNYAIAYPSEKIAEAEKDLLFCEFHDILPGSQIKAAEDDSLRQMDHGLEILDKLKLETFFMMLESCAPAKDGEFPLFVFNPHPKPVETVISTELQLPDQNWVKDSFTGLKVFDDDKELPSQIEKEASNITLDWRKKIVFEAALPPLSIKRFDIIMQPPVIKPVKKINKTYIFKNETMSICFNRKTGEINKIIVNGKSLVRPGAGRLVFMEDVPDSWGIGIQEFTTPRGIFTLMSSEKAGEIAGLNGGEPLEPFRIIEDGNVRTVIEVLLNYNGSHARLRYFLPKRGNYLDIEIDVSINIVNKMLKFVLPGAHKRAKGVGQDIYGQKVYKRDGSEQVILNWAALKSEKNQTFLAIMSNSGYGIDFYDGVLCLSLLRTPAYSAMQLPGLDIMPFDRLNDRIDVGTNKIKLRVMAGDVGKISLIEQAANEFHQEYPVLQFFPNGKQRVDQPLIILDGSAVMSSCKYLAETKQTVIRVFNPENNVINANFTFNNKSIKINLDCYEFKTIIIDHNGSIIESSELL